MVHNPETMRQLAESAEDIKQGRVKEINSVQDLVIQDNSGMPSDRFKNGTLILIREEVVKRKSPQEFLRRIGGIKMAELAEIVRENVGKNSNAMRQFFQQMVKRRELKAYCVEVNKRIVEKDTEDEEVVRTRKGATLTPTEKLREYQPVIIEDPETGVMYNLDIGCRGGMFFDDGDSQTIYHHCVLERIAQRFDPRKVADRTSFGDSGSFKDGISIPREMVTARLRVSYDENWESGGEMDYIAGTRMGLVVEGKRDDLFNRVCEFVREK